MKKSIYAWAVEENRRQEHAFSLMNVWVAKWTNFVFPLVKKWEERKPPENASVMRSLELRG